MFARPYLGLGDPPLSMADPELEYLFKPNQRCHRFGNLITYNEYSMRANPDFPKHKSDPNEIRVMVVGDSIVNGGSQTDDRDVATSIIQREVTKKFHRPAVVGNISAGSWGPPNELAYLKRYGLFDADVVVFVLNSGDYADVPTFEPVVGVDPGFPDKKPWFALSEALTRYVLPKISALHSSTATPTTVPTTSTSASDMDLSMRALTEMFDMAKVEGASMILLQYPDRAECKNDFQIGYHVIGDTTRKAGIPVVDVRDAFRDKLASGVEVYRDEIHPNQAGQQVIADCLLPEIEKRLAIAAANTERR